MEKTDMMKTVLTIAAVLMATSASAATVARNNVACDGGSVYGFTVRGNGMTHFVAEKNLSYCADSVVGVPASVDIYDPAEVVAWLEAEGYDIDKVQLRGKRTERTVLDVLDENGDPIPVLDDQGAPVLDADGEPVNETVTRVRTSRAVNGGW